ncbi:putative Ig domain-containing protein [Metalysinibacillus jejuensis]|uniref:putative Ig domain-containing protein n=1 Tax=Metalysinibacillus jejuensis TaxID=914327 RepID=UPI000D3B5184|nr:putative Ig domain-containing protein [Metalysinibacillus jejuensis]
MKTVTPVTPPALSYTNITGTKNSPITSVTPLNSNSTVVTNYAVKSESTLPNGLTLNTSTGEISGTPTVDSTTPVTIEASYDDNGKTKTVDVTVNITIS